MEAPVHGENEDSAEAPAAEEQAVESSASVENTAPPDEGETPISEDTAPQEEAPVDTASALRRTAVTHRSDTSILTIRSREEVETQEDREDVIWHEIHNAYRTRRILTGQLGGIEQLDNRKTVAVVDYKGFRHHYPHQGDDDQSGPQPFRPGVCRPDAASKQDFGEYAGGGH